jgi:hypothetical protein
MTGKTKLPWIKFCCSDWRLDPALRQVGLAARGLWMDMLCIMHEAEPYGHLLVSGKPPTIVQLARSVGDSAEVVEQLLAELQDSGVFSVTGDGVIFSRRLVRDREKHLEDQANGRKGGNPNWRRGRQDAVDGAGEEGGNPPPLSKSTEDRDYPASQGGKPPPDLFGPVQPVLTKPPKPPADPDSPASRLFKEGLEIIGEHTGKTDRRANGALLGKFRKLAGEDDERLLGILRELKTNPKADIASWVSAALRAPKLVVDNVAAAEGDSWGIDAFAEGCQGVCPTTGEDRRGGKWLLDGRVILDVAAKRVAQAARFPAGKAFDWTPLTVWLRQGLKLDDILSTIQWMVAKFDDPPVSLRPFDREILKRRAA